MAALLQQIKVAYFITLYLVIAFALTNCAPKHTGADPAPVLGIRLDDNQSFYRALGDNEEDNEEDEECTNDYTVAWDPNSESNIAGYNVQVTNTDTGETTEYNAGNSTSIDLELPPGNYSITATAYDTNGLESEPSSPPLVIVSPPCPPDDPPNPDDDGDDTNVDTDGPSVDPSNNTMTATFTSGDAICPGQVFAVETSTDLHNWNQTGDILITPFSSEITVDTGGAAMMVMRLRALDPPIQVEPCGSSSSSQSSESSESTSYSSEDSSSSDSSYYTSSDSSSSDSTSSEQSSSESSYSSSSEQSSHSSASSSEYSSSSYTSDSYSSDSYSSGYYSSSYSSSYSSYSYTSSPYYY